MKERSSPVPRPDVVARRAGRDVRVPVRAPRGTVRGPRHAPDRVDARSFGRGHPDASARLQPARRHVRATVQQRGGRGAVLVAVAVHARRRRLHHVPPVHRPRRELEHPQPHRRRPQGAGAVSGDRRLQLPLHRGDHQLVRARVRCGDRHQLAAQPARRHHVERRRRRRHELQEVPAQPLEGRATRATTSIGG